MTPTSLCKVLKSLRTNPVTSRKTRKSTFPSRSGLEKLVKSLAKEEDSKFHALEESKVPLLLTKGVYPYDYTDCMDKIQEQQLPLNEAFYGQLTDKHISYEDYQHAQTAFETFQLQILGKYPDSYLLSELLLLADVFENFPSICLNYYGLDPAHLLDLSWSGLDRQPQDDLRGARIIYVS